MTPKTCTVLAVGLFVSAPWLIAAATLLPMPWRAAAVFSLITVIGTGISALMTAADDKDSSR
jgi:hypothetical protein